jgi:glyceraldehyde-3-phosphate dehydrogenase (NADP+)
MFTETIAVEFNKTFRCKVDSLVFGNPWDKSVFHSFTGKEKPAYIQELVMMPSIKGATILMKRRETYSNYIFRRFCSCK